MKEQQDWEWILNVYLLRTEASPHVLFDDWDLTVVSNDKRSNSQGLGR